MPTITRKEYDEKRRSPLQADRDVLDEMLAAGATVENLPQAPSPSFLGFVGEKVRSILKPKPEEDRSGSVGSRMGASWAENIKRRNALTNPDMEESGKEWEEANRGEEINETTSDTILKKARRKAEED